MQACQYDVINIGCIQSAGESAEMQDGCVPAQDIADAPYWRRIMIVDLRLGTFAMRNVAISVAVGGVVYAFAF